MNILDVLIKLRNDLKTWTTNNILALKRYIDSKVFSGDYNDLENKPDIIEDESENLNIVDEDGNIIVTINSNGIHSTNIVADGSISANSLEIDGENILTTVDNKINDMLDGKALKYLTTAEFEELSSEEKNRDDIVYQITDAKLSFEDIEDVPDFVLSENLNDYLPLSGGTVTGEIKLADGSSSDGYTSLSYGNKDGLNIITETSNSQSEITFGFNLNCDNIDMAAAVEPPELATKPLNGAVTIGVLSDNSAYVSADNFNGDLDGNAKSATKLVKARKIGNATFDGTADITLAEMGVPNITIITQAEYDALEAAGTVNPDTYYLINEE